ncbi:MAG: AAA family ATPase [Nitratireductor sp.]
MKKRGFLLGKFLPPHAGHLFMCRTAQALCDELTVLVCTLDREPINGNLRYDWMKKLLPEARVIHFTKDVPQEPADHPGFLGNLERHLQDGASRADRHCLRFRTLCHASGAGTGCKTGVIDPERLAFPVSGTAIRDNPYANWEMVPGPVRPFYQKRIVLMGAESTGKSTLALQLARHFKTLHVPEYGRIYDAFRTQEWSAESFSEIEAGHGAMREALATEAGPLLIEDTDELATRVWEGALNGTSPDRPRPPRLADLFLLLATDLPWRDDGTRYMAENAFPRKIPEGTGRGVAGCWRKLERNPWHGTR